MVSLRIKHEEVLLMFINNNKLVLDKLLGRVTILNIFFNVVNYKKL